MGTYTLSDIFYLYTLWNVSFCRPAQPDGGNGIAGKCKWNVVVTIIWVANTLKDMTAKRSVLDRLSTKIRITHPVWLLANVQGRLHHCSASGFTACGSVDAVILRGRSRRLDSLVFGKDLYAPDMGILSILMVFADPHLQDPQSHTRLAATTLSFKRHFLPASRLFACPCTELNKSVVRAMDSSKELNLSRGVGFVKGEIEIHAKFEYGDGAWEVGGEKMGLWPIGLPKGRWYRIE